MKGKATAQLTVDGDFDVKKAINETISAVEDSVQNITDVAEQYVEEYFEGVFTKFDDGIDASDFALPTFNYSLDIDVPTIPKARLQFQFDGLELYMLVDTVLSLGATYTLNLYTSNTPVGISVGEDLDLGVIFTVDLILGVEGEIDISSGFHIKLDDGITIDIPLFDNNVSDVNL